MEREKEQEIQKAQAGGGAAADRFSFDQGHPHVGLINPLGKKIFHHS